MYYKKAFDFSDVIFEPAASSSVESRSQVTLDFGQKTYWSDREIYNIPVINAPMDVVGCPRMVDTFVSKKMLGCLGKYYNYYDLKSPYDSFKTYGLDLDIYKEYSHYIGISEIMFPHHHICLDVPNGYLTKFVDLVKNLRSALPRTVIMAGNVCTPEGAQNLFNAGADIIKVGIAQGGHCDTKNKAGVGLKQASTIYEISQNISEHALICSDGGIKRPADIGKAIGLGAHFVMIGTMLAGYDENDGEWQYEGIWPFRRKKSIKFYGMSSRHANEKHNGGLKSYRTSEGLETNVPYKGSVLEVIQDIKGSLASTCTYLNINNLSQLRNHPNLRCIL